MIDVEALSQDVKDMARISRIDTGQRLMLQVGLALIEAIDRLGRTVSDVPYNLPKAGGR